MIKKEGVQRRVTRIFTNKLSPLYIFFMCHKEVSNITTQTSMLTIESQHASNEEYEPFLKKIEEFKPTHIATITLGGEKNV
jgi:hypothetical protein